MENESNETVEVNTLPLGSPEEMSLQATENNEVLVSEASEIATQGAKNEEKKVKRHSFKTWFKNHIPTKRRIIQYIRLGKTIPPDSFSDQMYLPKENIKQLLGYKRGS